MVFNITYFATSESFLKNLHHDEQIKIVGKYPTQRALSKTVKKLWGTYVTMATIFYYFHKTVIINPREFIFKNNKDQVSLY